ncbi:MAG TPA: DUF1801 domain-containing protein [Gemmatimonadaceae bacterium]
MARSQASTVEEYLEELPPGRREVVAALRSLILTNLPAGYEEGIGFGMIGYGIPLADYPHTYNRQPLSCVALAAQKHYFALYLTCVYGDPERETWLRERFRGAGKKLDMGKSCIRFRSLDDLPLDAIAELVAGTPPARLIERYEAVKGKPG